MIYLRTGLPGASKTLNSIKEIVEDSALLGRPRYYYNVKLFFLDYSVCDSFQGYFYGVYLPSLDDKAAKKTNKVLLGIHRDDELATVDHFPFLKGQFESWRDDGGAVSLFLSWVKKLYPKQLTKKLDEYLGLVGFPSWQDVEHFHFHFTRFDDPTSWYTLPKGSVILIDECQQFFPPRSIGSKVPRHCAEFETHRHSGFDVHLITQDAKLLDAHVRRLVNRHIHYHNPLASKKVSRLQSDKAFDPSDYHQKKNTVSSFINRDSRYYGVYWSADLHTHKTFIPKKLVILVVLGFIVPGVLVLWFLARFGGDDSPAHVPVAQFIEQQENFKNIPIQSHSNVSTLPIDSFNVVEHPLSSVCDKITVAGHELIRSAGRVQHNIYIQCEKSLPDVSKNPDDEKPEVLAEAYLLDSNYLDRLGYSLKLDKGLVTLQYGNLRFLFPTFI